MCPVVGATGLCSAATMAGQPRCCEFIRRGSSIRCDALAVVRYSSCSDTSGEQARTVLSGDDVCDRAKLTLMPPAGPRVGHCTPRAATPSARLRISSKATAMKRRLSSSVRPAACVGTYDRCNCVVRVMSAPPQWQGQQQCSGGAAATSHMRNWCAAVNIYALDRHDCGWATALEAHP